MKINLDSTTEYILSSLEKEGFSAYVVGGSLRDMLLGLPTHDTDITTSATPLQVKEVFSSMPVIETGIQHGTVTLVLKHIPYEITTMRTEGIYSDNRRPDSVSFTNSIEEDLQRRDFTINALAYSPKSGLIDLFDGLNDLQNKVLKAVGNPVKRFSEDALRILRGLRFLSVLGFSIDPNTKSALLECSPLLKNISVERIYSELLRTLAGENADSVLREFLPIFELILPEMFLPEKDITILPTPVFRLASLFRSVADVRKCLHRLKADNETVRCVTTLVSSVPIPVELIDIKKYCHKNANSSLNIALYRELLFDEKGSILRVKTMIDSGECYSLGQLAVNGSDLVSLGFSGKEIGTILMDLLDKVIAGNLENKKETLLNAVKNIDKQ